MKKKWIVAFIACRSTPAWRGDCICGKNKQSESVKGGICQ